MCRRCRDLLLISSKRDKDLSLEGTVGLELDWGVFDVWLSVEEEVDDEREAKDKD